MEDTERLKAIIDELLKVNQTLTLEKAILAADFGAAMAKVEYLQKQADELQVHTVTTKE